MHREASGAKATSRAGAEARHTGGEEGGGRGGGRSVTNTNSVEGGARGLGSEGGGEGGEGEVEGEGGVVYRQFGDPFVLTVYIGETVGSVRRRLRSLLRMQDAGQKV